MLNAVSVHHPVLSLARRCLLPALACRRHPPSLPSVAVAVSHRCLSLPQSSSPIHCLCCLLSLSLVPVISHRRRQMPSSCQQIILPVAVISCRRPPFLQFLVYCHHYFLLAADILTIYHPPLLCFLPPPMLVNSSVLSPPLSLLSAIVVLFCLKRSSPLLVSLKHSLRLVESAVACPLSY